jgi:quercetin dioxygenase-like cupin family protein
LITKFEHESNKDEIFMKYLVKQADVAPYSPANHTGTRNFRLIGPDTVGAKQVEVLIGELERGKGALPHAHPGIEQVCYLLEGSAHVEVGGEAFDMQAGDACFFPAGEFHVFKATSERAKVMVIYAPPYLEKPENVRK